MEDSGSSPARPPALRLARSRTSKRRTYHWLICHVFLFLGVYQIGYTPDQWQTLRARIALQGDLGVGATLRTIGALGLIRSYFRTNSDERLYREYAQLMLSGRADFAYIASKHGVDRSDPEVARPVPYRDVRVEYPPLALVLGMLPPALLASSYLGYRVGLAAWLLGIQLLNVWLANRLLARSSEDPWARFAELLRVSFWFCLLLGVPVATRLDALTTLSLLAAVLCLERSLLAASAPARRWALGAGIAAGLGAMIKLVPLLSLPVALGTYAVSRRPDRGQLAALTFAAAALVAGGTHVLCWFLFGDGYLETYRYHTGRGLQLESSYAGLLMFARMLGFPLQLALSYGWGSANLASPIADACARFSPFVLLVLLGLLLALVWHRRALAPRALLATVILLFILSAKVLSPQYLIWLFPLLVCGVPAPQQGHVTRLLLAAAAISQVLYPRAYSLLEQFHPVMVVLLNLRNGLLLALLVLCWRSALARAPIPSCP